MPNMERDWEELKEELKPIISFTFVYGIVSYLEHLGYQEVWKLVSCTLMALNLVTGLILLVVYTMTPRYLQVCLFVCQPESLFKGSEAAGGLEMGEEQVAPEPGHCQQAALPPGGGVRT